MTTAEPVRTEIDKVASLVFTARRLLGEGRHVDLSALEGKVQEACRDIAALPVPEGRHLLPDLEDLVTALDELAADIDDQFRSMGGVLPDPGQVAKAYSGQNE